jgi:hypothetical protein
VYSELLALAQVIVIDLVLAGDNAIVVGLAASRVAPELRAKVIFWGIAGAVVLRIAFAALATQNPGNRRPCPRRWHTAVVGVLENVSSNAAWAPAAVCGCGGDGSSAR